MATAKTKAKPAATASKGTAQTLHGLSPYEPKKSEEYMNEKQREHFKQILQAWRRELMEEVDRTVTHMKDEAANFPDPADRATQEEEFSLELRTRDRERKLIKKIDKTLVRVEEDDYGFCDQCGVDIGIRRLEARPTADLCVDCKTLDEIKEKQITGG
jgi:DnaK suppressor protein